MSEGVKKNQGSNGREKELAFREAVPVGGSHDHLHFPIKNTEGGGEGKWLFYSSTDVGLHACQSCFCSG